MPSIRRVSTSPRTGFTLIELLVAMAITLTIMGSVVALFASVNQGINESIGSISVQERLRHARNLLADDLAHLTVNPAIPPTAERAGGGYLSIVAGATDKAAYVDSGTSLGQNAEALRLLQTWKGVTSDSLAFTIRGRSFPSSGLHGISSGGPGEPTAAEVVWAVSNGVLYRRVLPILPGHVASGTTSSLSQDEFYSGTSSAGYPPLNVSRRFDGTTGTFNSLVDLEEPTNRHVLNYATAEVLSESVVLDNVVGFDVRVWDPGAPLFQVTDSNGNLVIVEPSDGAYEAAISNNATIAGFGAFVDVGYAYTSPVGSPPAQFSSTSPPGGGSGTYDTWTRQRDGLDTGNPIERPSDGLDSDGRGGVDDPGERADSVSPPYLAPLKAVQITIRVYEPASQTIREVTIRQGFTN